MDKEFKDELYRLGTAVNVGGSAQDTAALNAWQKGVEARLAALEEAARKPSTTVTIQADGPFDPSPKKRINVRDGKDGE